MTPFRHDGHLGNGFFGRVELEYDEGLNRQCAAKYIENTAFTLTDFAEAQAMELGKHDNVVTVYSTAVENGIPVIRMEYLEEGSVARKYGREPAPVREALLIMEAACRGVDHIHNVGLLHRDIKPANLLLDATHIAKVSDFGLACESIKVTEAISLPYLAHLPPEAIADGTNTITAVTGDVYALGLTTYRLLNGDRRVRPKMDTRSPAPDHGDWMPYIHRSLRAAIKKALHRDPLKRTKTAAAFRHALEKVRPVVSWQPAPKTGQSDILHSWQGSTLDGTDWQATVHRKSPTKFRFTVERRLLGKSWRAQNGDKLDSTTAADALAHAATVLQRVATDGI